MDSATPLDEIVGFIGICACSTFSRQDREISNGTGLRDYREWVPHSSAFALVHKKVPSHVVFLRDCKTALSPMICLSWAMPRAIRDFTVPSGTSSLSAMYL